MPDQYRCIMDVNMKRGGDFAGVAFTKGKIYPCQGKENGDYILINDQQTRHQAPPRFLSMYFRAVNE